MSIALSLTVSGLKSKNRTDSLLARIRAKKVLIGGFAFGLLVSLAILYFVQINALTVQSYQINQYQQDLTRLKERNRQLEFQTVTLQSQQTLAQKIETLGLVKSAQADYFLPSGSSVAVR